MATAWLETLKSASKTCLVQQGRMKYHYTFDDGNEMAEEYDIETNDLLVRKWKKCGMLGGKKNWDFEIGGHTESVVMALEAEDIAESAGNPIFLRKDTRLEFQWRIRNLPYPLDNYDVQVDNEQKCIIVRTVNKKYYKKFPVPDLERADLPLEQNRLRLAHANKTLIISYEKPAMILDMQKTVQAILAEFTKSTEEGYMNCS